MWTNKTAHQFACRYTPLGTQTLSKAPNRYVEGIYPSVIESAKGCLLADVEGHTYIDYIAALGPIILGYADPRVDQAVINRIQRGILFSLPADLEGYAASTLSKLSPSTQMWKFTKTGSDACSMAVKIARAYTQKDHIVACGYHGWHDWYSIVNQKKLGIPASLDAYITKVPYNDLDSMEKAITDKTAAVIMEPQIFDMPKVGYLESIRKLCDQKGILLIFDETVTGFRYPDLLAQNHFHVYPELTIIGKAAGNGYPFAAVGGYRRIMKICENDNFFASTTFGGDCIGLTACLAVMEHLPGSIDDMMVAGSEIASVFSAVFQDRADCIGFPTRTMFKFPTTEHKALFWQECCKRGIMFGYSNFIMEAHLEQTILDKTFDVIEEAGKVTLNNWDNPSAVLEGPAPVEVFRLLRS